MSAVVATACLNAVAGAVHMDALMSSVPAGGVAELAANTFFFVDAGDNFVVEVEVLPFLDARKAEGLEVGDSRKALFAHPVGEAVSQVFDDAVAVVHDGGADLYGAATKQ